MRAYRIGALASIVVIVVVGMTTPAFAADPQDVAKNAEDMWAAVGGTIALLILGYIGIKVLPGRRLGEIIGGIALGLVCVSLIVTAPAWIKFVDDTVTKLLATWVGTRW
jgi:hypothetical protein